MSSVMKSYYVIDDSTTDFDRVVADLDGYWKFLSIVYLRKLGLPVLDGVIVTKWNNTVYKTIMNFCRNNGWRAILLRHDKKPERPPYPMGGYLVSLEDIQNESLKYLELGRIVFLMEPCSPFDNSYNVNLLFQNDKTIVLEAVGPGFDASDLQRGYTTPHERIQIKREMTKTGTVPAQSSFEQIVKRTYIVDQKTYQNSVRERYLKIGRRLQNLGKISVKKSEISENELVGIAKSYLKDNGHRMLLLNENIYKPIPIHSLYEIYSYIHSFPEMIEQNVNCGMPFVVSSSYVNEGAKLVFWDIVWPQLKYEV